MAERTYHEAMTPAIRPIASSDVHRITSGQVVLDLQTAVKELVENALDAGSTNIAVHFKDYGADSFEVVDNGCGLDPSNHASVALKHYTSKLSSFSDLSLVRTFGFRGEALSSLCALADVTIHTATHEEAPVGTILQLDGSGKVADSSKRAARQRGTTITITGLFKTLPVRRKEFEKNLKREYNKAQNLLQAYALISKGVRWSTTNIPKAGRRIPQFSVNSSNGDNYLLGNIGSLFGAKVTPTLMSLELDLAFSTDPGRSGCHKDDEETARVRVIGLISKPTYGSGRTSSDRQYYYINGRPWDAGRVSRAFNEVYKSFNSNQLPFVVADFKLPTDSYDVNVSPDKRTIFLHEESRLIEKVKEGLEALFAPSRATFLVNGASHSLRPSGSSAVQSRLGQFAQPPQPGNPQREQDNNSLDNSCDAEDVQTRDAGAEANETGKPDSSNYLEYREDTDTPVLLQDDQSEPETLFPVVDKITTSMAASGYEPSEADDQAASDISGSLHAPMRKRRATPSLLVEASSSDDSTDQVIDTTNASWSPTKRQRMEPPNERTKGRTLSATKPQLTRLSLKAFAMPGSQLTSSTEEKAVRMNIGLDYEPPLSSEESNANDVPSPGPDDVVDTPEVCDTLRHDTYIGDDGRSDEEAESIVLPFKLADVRSRVLAQVVSQRNSHVQASKETVLIPDEQNLQDEAGLDSRDETQVEQALSRVMHKADFERLEVIGQFNLGFIIARRKSEQSESGPDNGSMDDLFIVDQHASDEKFNFEQLQEHTRIQSQDLIAPRSLELSASDELVAIEHQATLSKNGFEVSILESGLPGTRVKLLSQPISKTTVFGVKDLEELLYLLRDVSPDSEAARAIRCSKARSMFASRACRKSIMIGTALSKARMKSILTNMGTIEQPWNCPHGRPTMRHLTCLNTQQQHCSPTNIDDLDEDRSALLHFAKQ